LEQKDLIIGVYSNYKLDALKPWYRSIKKTGFKGDVVLIGVGMDEDTVKALVDEGVIAIQAPHSTERIHMQRFAYINMYLKDKWKDYRYVVTTDVRDVIFQKNPMDYIEIFPMYNTSKLFYIAISEAIKIKDEAWNRENILKCFGQYFYDEIKDRPVLNVGILAGGSEHIKDLVSALYQLSLNRNDWVADQAAYNVMMNWQPYRSATYIAELSQGWAINAHVTSKPEQLEEFGPYLLEKRPVFEDGLVKDGKTGKVFHIVHQYDRVPEWKEYFNELYKDK
jgi:hypothetical protein